MKTGLKNKIILGLWLLATLIVLVLFVAAKQQQKQSFCKGIVIEIIDKPTTTYINKNEIAALLSSGGSIETKAIQQIDIQTLEKVLKQNLWVQNAELYLDNKNYLHAIIKEREPVARLFTLSGENFYIDSFGLRMPSQLNIPSRSLIVTGFPSSNAILSKADSIILNGVTHVATKIYSDSLLSAQITQLNITPTGNFELTPLIGNQIILLGNAIEVEQKTERLKTFYQYAWLQNGINKYEKIDVRFNNQIVATKTGAKNFNDSIQNKVNADTTRLLVPVIIDSLTIRQP